MAPNLRDFYIKRQESAFQRHQQQLAASRAYLAAEPPPRQGGSKSTGFSMKQDYPVFEPGQFEAPKAPPFQYAAYERPERDPGQVEEYRTKAAAPGVRAATRAVQQALLKEYRNPNLARLAMRDVLGGHGEALSRIYGGAAQTAEAQYAPEYAADVSAAQMKYQAGYGAAGQKYQAEWGARREKAMQDWRAKVEAQKRKYEIELEEYYDEGD